MAKGFRHNNITLKMETEDGLQEIQLDGARFETVNYAHDVTGWDGYERVDVQMSIPSMTFEMVYEQDNDVFEKLLRHWTEEIYFGDFPHIPQPKVSAWMITAVIVVLMLIIMALVN